MASSSSSSSSSRLPALTLITSSAPAKPVSTSPSFHKVSQSPFRYVHIEDPLDEKAGTSTQLQDVSDRRASLRTERPRRSRSIPRQQPHHHSGRTPTSLSSRPDLRPATPSSTFARHPSPFQRAPAPLLIDPPTSSRYTRPRGLRIWNLLKAWAPALSWAATSLGFLLAVTIWKTEVFQGLDALSTYLKSDEYLGYAILFFLIFLTTFPPLPLYSTLIILSGYTYGPWTGAVISYFAALTGALVVFTLSRHFLRDSISRCLTSAGSVKRVVRAIEKRPKLLFLIRLAPYPYNVMNCLLAASPVLTLRTYTVCTALSLFKVIIHTSIGASIHSFAEYHTGGASAAPDADHDEEEHLLNKVFTIFGIALCVGIFLYLSYVARRAVNDELDDDIDGPARDMEEGRAFLASSDSVNEHESVPAQQMAESPFSARPTVFRREESSNHVSAAMAVTLLASDVPNRGHGQREEFGIGL